MAIYAWNKLNPDDLMYNHHEDYCTILNWWQDQELQTVEDYQTFLENYLVAFACTSNQIEGVEIDYHTTRELYETGKVTNYSGTPQDLLLIYNQKLTFSCIISSVVNHVPITTDFIKDIHKRLMHGCYDETRYNKGERPGKYKVNDYCVGITEEGSYPEEVPEDMDDLIEQLNLEEGKDPHIIAAYFHVCFEAIHPFADGNGRLGRLLLNYYLLTHNHPPVVVYPEDKYLYYECLETFDTKSSLGPMVQFLEAQVVKTWKRYVKRKGVDRFAITN